MSFIFIFYLIFFLSDTDSLVAQTPWSPTSCTKSNTQSAHKNSPVSETFLFSFLGDQVFASQIKTKEEIFWVTPTP